MTPRLPTPRSAEAAALRVVFFGAPRSGKTNLLEAFERVASAGAETEPILLKSAGHSSASPREVVPRIVLIDLPDSNTHAGAVVLIDCDGEAAAELLRHPEQLQRDRARGELASAIRRADALILIIEARSTEGEIESHFRAFDDFLRGLRAGRTFGREVGGWPIFLTLTKCDLLFEPGMPAHAWLERVELEKDRLRVQFVERFGEAMELPEGEATFGSLQLDTEATAVRMPEELRASAYSLEEGLLNLDVFVPAVLEAAAGYHQRQVSSARRLKWTAGGIVSLLAGMLLLLVGLFTIGEPTPLEKLAARVQALQTQAESPANRLAEKNIALRKAELERIEQSREFGELPESSQQFVRSRLREIEAYTAYRAEFFPPQFAPADVRTLGMYQRLEQELDTKLAPPAEYSAEWEGTEAVRLRQKWRSDLQLLSDTEARLHDWYRRLITDATELIANPLQPDWRARIGRVIQDSNEPPFPAFFGSPGTWNMQPVPGSQAIPIARGEALTFGDVLRYERVDFAKRDWELAERRLLDLRDLTDALGLTADPDFPNQPAVLNLPEPSGNRADSLSLASLKLAQLKSRFPRAAEGTAYWQAASYPDPLRQELSRRLALVAETGDRQVRSLIVGELKLDSGRADTPADWRKLVSKPGGLLLQPEMGAWGRFLQLLHAWSNSPGQELDPVVELAEFLKRDRFAIPLSAIEITLPNSLRVQVLTPDGSLRMTVTGEGKTPRELSLKPTSEVRSDATGRTYRFVPEIPLTPLDYRPGESFTAELPLKGGTTKYLLRWTRSRTETFAFEKLLLEPDLDRLLPLEKTGRAPGVRVKLLPEKPGGFVPELLPALRGLN